MIASTEIIVYRNTMHDWDIQRNTSISYIILRSTYAHKSHANYWQEYFAL